MKFLIESLRTEFHYRYSSSKEISRVEYAQERLEVLNRQIGAEVSIPAVKEDE